MDQAEHDKLVDLCSAFTIFYEGGGGGECTPGTESFRTLYSKHVYGPQIPLH